MKKIILSNIVALTIAVFGFAQPDDFCGSSQSSDTVHIIKFDSAVYFISQFATKFKDVAAIDGAGTEIPLLLDLYEIKIVGEPHCGLVNYYCYRPKSIGKPSKLFISYEVVNDWDDENIYEIDVRKPHKCIASVCDFKFDSSDFADIESSILKYAYICNAKSDSIKRSDILSYGYSFLSRINEHLSKDFDFCPLGLIHRIELYALLNQTINSDESTETAITGMRIYFGYNKKDINSPIRSVIFAVNNLGKNLCKDKNGKDYIILEKSWPPGNPK